MIKLMIIDVDGTLTDGKIYMGNEGEVFKAFDIKDGCGIKDILPSMHIVPVIITARESKILENRCNELDIEFVYQGVRDKFVKLKNILDELSQREKRVYSLSDCAYIGDDILDLQCMKPIKQAGGIIGCPSDAIEAIREIADFISDKSGGNGAVREFVEWLKDNR